MQQLHNSSARLRQKDTANTQIPRCLFHLRKHSMCHASHHHEALHIKEKWLVFSEVRWEKKKRVKHFSATCTIIEDLSWAKSAALWFAWHGDPTNWSYQYIYQHLHLCVINFLKWNGPFFHRLFKTSIIYKIKQDVCYFDHLLLVSSISSIVPYPFPEVKRPCP